MTKHALKHVRQPGWLLLVAGVMGVGLALRVGMAWAMRYSANGDFGIVALMARHMAQGADYPVFRYGVAYMGGLEPALSALMSFFMKWDCTAFPINLGTALVGVFLLPLVYVFARDAGGRRAGLIAMLYCLVGSDTLLHYSVAPRGGYMSMMVGGLLALWMTCRVVTLENQGRQASKGAFWIIGLAAGIAWWATQLVTVFIVVAGLVALAGWRWWLVWRGLVPGALGFFLGSLPWWWWNATHQWVSLDFGSSLGKVSFGEGLESFWNLFQVVVEMPVETWVGLGRLLLLGVLAGGFLWILVRDKLRGKDKQAFYYRLAVPLLVVAMALFYSTSQFVRANASRYLMPMVPALAVMVGVSCDQLLRRFRFPWGWIVAFLGLPVQILLLPRMFDGVAADQARWDLASRLETEVAPLCGGVFVGDYYAFHWLNYAAREKLCVAALPMERYAPYARRAELAEHPAFLDNYEDVDSFLAGTRSRYHQVFVNGVSVDSGVAPPSDDWEYVASSNVMAVRSDEGTNLCGKAGDSALAASWSAVLPPQTSRSLVFSFARAVPLSGIRLISLSGRYPAVVSVEGRADAHSPWCSLFSPSVVTRYFWSGSHLLLDGIQYFAEFRFDAPPGGVNEVRLIVPNQGERNEAIRLNHILFLEKAVRQPLALPSIDQCVDVLRGHKVRQVYAPRWLADRIAMAVPAGEMSVQAPSLMTRRLDELSRLDPVKPSRLAFRETTGLILDERDARRSREVLAGAGLEWQESRIGPLVLMVVQEPEPGRGPKSKTLLFWTEQGCFSMAKPEKQKLSPSEASGRIRFENGIELVQVASGDGVDGNRLAVKRGQSFPLTYLWKFPVDVELSKWVVFVHVKTPAQRLVFQDDRIPFDNLPPDGMLYQEPGDFFPETRKMTVPASVQPGEYRIWVGLVERRSAHRIKAASALKMVKKAVELPLVVTVEP